MILLLIITIFLLLPVQDACSENNKTIQDLSVLIGEERLEFLHKQQQEFLFEPRDWYYNNLLLEESREAKNIKYQAIALANRVAYYYRYFDKDSIFHYAQEAEEFMLKNKCCKDLYLVRQLVIYRYLDQGYYSLGLKKALAMRDEVLETTDNQLIVTALLTLGNAYRTMGVNDEAIRCFKDARVLGSPPEDAPYKPLECYASLASCYQNLNENDSTFLYADSLFLEINRIKKKYPVYNLEDWEIGAHLYKAHSYIEESRLNLALAYIEKADSLMNKKATKYPYYYFLSNAQKMRYYKASRDFDKTTYYYQVCDSFCRKNNLESEMRMLLRFKAITYGELGWHEAAVDAYKTMENHIDSVNKDRFLHEINQLRADYEEGKYKDMLENQRERIVLTSRFNITLAALLLLLLALCFLIWRNLRSIQKKNRSLFTTIKDLTKTKKELLEFKDRMRNRVVSDLDRDTESAEDKLFAKVEEFMKTEKPYINSKYGRKDLIADMNTNEVYLAKAIRKGCDITIHEYINNWRMECAKSLLLENLDLTIEAVSIDSGFASIRNFYRLFKDVHGISPSEFRNYIVNNYKPKSS